MGSPLKVEIRWLLVDSLDAEGYCHHIMLPDDQWQHMYMEEFTATILPEEIRKWFGFRPELSQLKLWIPRNPIESCYVNSGWITEHAKDFDPSGIAKSSSVELLSPINQFLGDGEPLHKPPEGQVHLIVTLKRQRGEQKNEGEEEHDTLSKLGLMHQNYRNVIKGIAIPSPSAAAKSSQYAKLQANPQTTIHDGFYTIGRPANTSALPITIYHRAFQRFVENIATAKPSKELLADVQALMTVSTGVGTVESHLAENPRSALTNILGKYMDQVVVGGAIADGVIRKMGEKTSIPLLVMEYKRAVGEGGCDPLIQASYSTLKHWRSPDLSQTRDKCCCPTFIIAGGGPYLAVLGAVITDKYIVQRLTSLEWLGMSQIFEDEHLYRIAQIFDSLRGALRELDEFYGELDKQDLKLVDGNTHSRFYPYPATFTDSASKTVEFEYLRPLVFSSTKSPFLVRLRSSGEMAVVKFVARYGVDAHRLLAEAEMAPRLHFYGSVDGQGDTDSTPKNTKDVFGLHLGSLRMVIMDYIDGEHGEALETDRRSEGTYIQVKAMVDKLHGSDYVFGDLRPPNLMFSGNKAFLVDFDWAGKRGEVFYPAQLGEGITKYCEGRDFGMIEKEHDLALLDQYFSKV